MKINQNKQVAVVKADKEKALAKLEAEYQERKDYTEFLYDVLEHRIRMGYDRIHATIYEIETDIVWCGINRSLDNASIYSVLDHHYESRIFKRGYRYENGEKIAVK